MQRALAELVQHSSFTEDRDAVNRAAECVGQYVMPQWTKHVYNGERYADTVVYRSGTHAQTSAHVVLVGHVDTVFPPDVFQGFSLDGDRARGPGVLDMKGGLVVAAWGLRAAIEAGHTEGVDLRSWSWVIVGDEEVGSPESASVLQREALGADAALVFESGRAHDKIITARKGTGSLTVQATGVAAHAGNAHDRGKNAIWSLARWIDAAQQLTDYSAGLTINVGVIRGGSSKNTVPDQASAMVDFRYIKHEQCEWLKERLTQLAAQCAVDGTQLRIEWTAGRAPLEKTVANSALMAQYARCQRESGLGDGEQALVGGGSDASTTASVGVPSIDALGVRGEGFHTVHEYAELASLVPKAEALARYLLGASQTIDTRAEESKT
jgi:glutamate carboxypeptidase